MSKLVVFILGDGNFEQGFPVKLQILEDGDLLPSTQVAGNLPPCPEITEFYSNWQSSYRHMMSSFRLEAKAGSVVSTSPSKIREAAQVLSNSLNTWLNSEPFRSIKEELLLKLGPSEKIRAIVQTEDLWLQKMPWHLWDLFEHYPKAEVTLSSTEYERVAKHPHAMPRNKVKILAIIGDSTGIDIQKDRALLEQLPDAEIKFLVERERRELHDQLWEQSWDILFFAGHSRTEKETGIISINETDSLTIAELKYALRRSIEQGLQLAIFNSCDGLGLAKELADLHIPRIVVMREPVPDRVAQEFLKYFLKAFANGKSLYAAVGEARERLQGLENEFPCASWLPVICQNPAEAPLTWEQLLNRSPVSPVENGQNLVNWSKLLTFTGKTFTRKFGWIVLLLGLGLVGWRFVLPKLAIAANNGGFDNYSAGQLSQAQEALQLATTLNPNIQASHYIQGRLCEDVRDFDCAREKYRVSAKLGLDAAYSELARLYIIHDKDYSAAVNLVWQGLDQTKDNKDNRVKYALHKNLGWARLSQSRYEEASTHLQDAIKLDNKRASGYCLLAQVKEELGEREGANAAWETCLNYATPEKPEEDIWIDMARQRLEVDVRHR